MDPSLLREREAFKKRALAQPTVEKRKNRDESSQAAKRPKPPQRPRPGLYIPLVFTGVLSRVRTGDY